MMQESFSGLGQLDTSSMAVQQRRAQCRFKIRYPFARRTHSQMGLPRTRRYAALACHDDEQRKGD
jgi:hypothetical protein